VINEAQVSNVVSLEDALLATKLFRPVPRSHLVHPRRLLDFLSGGLSSPLTVVVAPAG
jgi:ATP/maltotriose-dependent transcriptional regulator MalT